MLQEEIRSTLSVSTHESTTIILAFRASAIKNEKWTELIDVLLSLQASKRTSIRECEDWHTDLSTVEKNVLDTIEVNILTAKRILSREEFRKQLLKGMPFQDSYFLKNLFSNN